MPRPLPTCSLPPTRSCTGVHGQMWQDSKMSSSGSRDRSQRGAGRAWGSGVTAHRARLGEAARRPPPPQSPSAQQAPALCLQRCEHHGLHCHSQLLGRCFRLGKTQSAFSRQCFVLFASHTARFCGVTCGPGVSGPSA